ncbi:hypothetical protein Rhopal_007742-T1 [Rhodotorula paludigena]|uniref:Rad1-domain-containing protein n=1 Tax=Rhodotorula paludigena TaxID=86838 RepID=A0AAV5GVT7_9BASI|nr:hypothetical protein Rhopal_007742-T1 [Rhodotorula paludigena]
MPPAPRDDILLATMPDVRPLASILRALAFKHVTHAYIAASAFSSYQFELDPEDPAAYVDGRPEPSDPSSSASPPSSPVPTSAPYCQMTVSLATILECLNIFGNAGGSSNPFKREGDGEDEEGGGCGGRWRGGKRRRMGSEEYEEPRGGGRLAHEEGKTTSLRLSFAGEGQPLVLLLEESGIVTRCEITSYEPEALLDLAFSDEDKVQRLIIKSDWLRDALAELPPSSEKLTISFSPPQDSRARGRGGRYRYDDSFDGGNDGEEEEVPLFRIESVGTMGSTEMDYSDDKDVLEAFECDHPLRNTYKFSHIQLTKVALQNSIKASIRTDAGGLVSFQFMIPLSPRGAKASIAENKIGFVEFLCVALDEDY